MDPIRSLDGFRGDARLTTWLFRRRDPRRHPRRFPSQRSHRDFSRGTRRRAPTIATAPTTAAPATTVEQRDSAPPASWPPSPTSKLGLSARSSPSRRCARSCKPRTSPSSSRPSRGHGALPDEQGPGAAARSASASPAEAAPVAKSGVSAARRADAIRSRAMRWRSAPSRYPRPQRGRGGGSGLRAP